MPWGWGWKPYVPVAARRAQARRCAQQFEKKQGRKLQPIVIEGRTIVRTFWGKAWCENLERYSDFSDRLPRGRTYVRNGSVIDLHVSPGKIKALVSGSEVYTVEVSISSLAAAPWKAIQQDCSQSIDSLMDLLQGRFSKGVMERLTRPAEGLFPRPKEIKMKCSCPDYAGLCKHIAAVLYGVGARLDEEPELLFVLRKVDHLDLVQQAVDGWNLDAALGSGASGLEGENLEELFGIDLDAGPTEKSPAPPPKKARPPQERSEREIGIPLRDERQKADGEEEAGERHGGRRRQKGGRQPPLRQGEEKVKPVREEVAPGGFHCSTLLLARTITSR